MAEDLLNDKPNLSLLKNNSLHYSYLIKTNKKNDNPETFGSL